MVVLRIPGGGDIIRKLAKYKRKKETIDRWERERVEDQRELVNVLSDIDPENKLAYLFRMDGTDYRAIVVKDKGESYDWDIPGLMTYLRKHNLWMSVSTRMLDFQKLNSEIAHDTTLQTALSGFMITRKSREPHVRIDVNKNKGVRGGQVVVKKSRGKGQETR